MYEGYWGLKEAPFENTPDSRFFYHSTEHEEALSRLQYLVRQRKACGVLTGVYGCGKTLVLHSLIKGAESEGNRFSIVTNPRLDDLGLLRLILHGFHMESVPPGKADVLMDLKKTIVGIADDGKHSVIVVDEAHAIEDPRVFEELRLLLNFQTENRFLTTLLLSGQPELKPRVEANKQLNQRVSLRCHLGAFGPEDTRNYVFHRLQVAGGKGDAMFTPEALGIVHRQSGGIPRWINQICHLTLLTGFSRRASRITPDIVEEAAQDLAGLT